jgi:hypothetical protein
MTLPKNKEIKIIVEKYVSRRFDSTMKHETVALLYRKDIDNHIEVKLELCYQGGNQRNL